MLSFRTHLIIASVMGISITTSGCRDINIAQLDVENSPPASDPVDPAAPSEPSSVIFEDNFEKYGAWSTASDNVSHTYPSSNASMLGGPCDYTTGLPCWYSWSQGAGSNGLAPPLFRINDASSKSGSQALTCNYEYSQYINGGSMDLVLTNGRTTGYDDIWYQAWLYIPDDFDPETASGGYVNPWKVLHSNTGVNIATESPTSTWADSGLKRGMQQYFQVLVDGNGAYRLMMIYLHGPDDYVEHTIITPSSNNFARIKGKWSFVQWHIRLNTFTGSTPNNDAVLDAWLIPGDELHTYDVTKPTLSFFNAAPGYLITDPARRTNALIVFGNMNPHLVSTTKQVDMSIDDLVVSTKPLGPGYVIGN